jgi:hypothetical protein
MTAKRCHAAGHGPAALAVALAAAMVLAPAPARALPDNPPLYPNSAEAAAVGPFQRMLWTAGIDLTVPRHGKFIFVNIPAYELIAFEDGKPLFRSRVVVGKPESATPDLISYMTGLKFNPDWTPTPSMIRNEAAVYIPAGPNSPLGRIKFELDNDQWIYLHDTNRKSLFDREMRARSHGCVRVEQFKQLAAWVDGVTVDAIERAIRGDRTFTRRLPRPVPVELGYHLVFPGVDGALLAYDDIYDRTDIVARPPPRPPARPAAPAQVASADNSGAAPVEELPAFDSGSARALQPVAEPAFPDRTEEVADLHAVRAPSPGGTPVAAEGRSLWQPSLGYPIGSTARPAWQPVLDADGT